MPHFRIFPLVAAVALTTACSDSDNDGGGASLAALAAPSSTLRITHASPDAPRVNVYVDGALALANVDYKQSSGAIARPPGDVDVEVRGILADGTELSVIGPATVTLEAGTRTDVVAYDSLFAGANLNIKPLILTTDTSEAIAEVRVAVLHAAPAVADVDIYVTAPDDPISSTAPIDLDFGESAGPLTLAANTAYRVRITPDGSSTVVYDSGTLSFNGGTDLLLAALENTTGIGDNPVNLLAVSDNGATEVFDSATGFEARVVHNSADTPAVDVLVNRARALSRISFREARAYSDLAAAGGNYNVVVAASDDNDIAPIALDLDLDQGASYTVVAVGALNGVVDNTLEAVLTRDDRRDVATEARLRVIHGSYAVARDIPVDVYLSADGDISSAAPAISSLAYASATEQLPVAAGDYIVTVTAAGDRSIVAYESATPVTLDAGVNYTVIARDPADGEDPDGNLVLLLLLTD